MPVPSDASTRTSLTASPLEPQDIKGLPIELKIPLPPSRSSSPRDGQETQGTENEPQETDERVPPNPDRPEFSIPQPAESDVVENTKTSAQLPPVAPGPPTPVHHLRHLALEADNTKRRTLSLREEYKRVVLLDGLNRRLKDTLGIAYGNMIDQYKGDDQAGFTGLFEASERLATRCAVLDGRSSTGDPQLDNLHHLPSQEAHLGPLHQLPSQDQTAITAFLNRLRIDANYLSDLVASMPPLELTRLTSCYHPAGVDLSVLSNHSHGRTQAWSRDSQMMKLSRRMDNIDLFHTQDPYFCLLHGIFDSSAPVDSNEYRLKMDTWASTCAAVMTGGKLGSEEFAISTLDSFVDTKDWLLLPEIELFLQEVLAEGWFVLDPPEVDSSEKTEGFEPNRASHAIAVAEFFDKYTRRLLTLLTMDSLSAAVPKKVLDLIHSILSRIQDGQMKELVKKFMVSRWYFASFLTSLLVYPEVRASLLNHHVGHSARERILKELALRLQSQVFSVLAPSSSVTFILPEIQDQVWRIMEYFEPAESTSAAPLAIDRDTVTHAGQLMLNHWDIITLIETLRPDEKIARSESAATLSGIPSSKASSATLRPTMSNSSNIEGPATDSGYAESSSTDGTLIGDSQAPDSVTQKNGHSYAGDQRAAESQDLPAGTEQPAPSLASISHRLRDLSKGRTNLAAAVTPLDWMLLTISHMDSTISSMDEASATSLPSVELSESVSEAKVLPGSQQPFQKVELALLAILASDTCKSDNGNGTVGSLRDLIDERLTATKARHSFQEAHQWWHVLKAYDDQQKADAGQSFSTRLTESLRDTLRERTRIQTQLQERLEADLSRNAARGRNESHSLRRLDLHRKSLRTKMWYSSDVKHSALYEDALRVTKALRAMTNPKKAKQPGGLAQWARQRLRGTTPYDRADKQALEAMVASLDHGGLAKLGDDQLQMTSKWLTKHSIENFCKGEERLHRFCFEVQKMVNKLVGLNLVDSPVLWSSHLFRRERSVLESRPRQPSLSGFPPFPMTPPPRLYHSSNIRSPTKTSLDPRMGGPGDLQGDLRSTLPPPQPLFQSISSNVPHYTHQSLPAGQTFGHMSPPMTPLSPRIVDGFSVTNHNRPEPVSKHKIDFVDDMKRNVLPLLISDLGFLLWSLGSETDAWINKATKQMEEQAQGEKVGEGSFKVQRTESRQQEPESRIEDGSDTARQERTVGGTPFMSSSQPVDVVDAAEAFNFTNAYSTLLRKFSLSKDPATKLGLLCELEDLIVVSIEDGVSHLATSDSPQTPDKLSPPMGKKIPRTKATSLEEVIANCTERREGTMKLQHHRSPLPSHFFTSSTDFKKAVGADAIVHALYSIFRDSALRPKTLFLDLQYIASFTPSSVLDHTAQGKAFWDTALAAMALKEDLLNNSIIRRASLITDYHLNAKKPPQLPPADVKIEPWLPQTTLKDAAQLYLIAAKEGKPAAARELALFFLTHPDLINLITRPFAKGRDVFSSTAGDRLEKSKPGLDPRTFAVVLHWMEVAASGGDREAAEFLRDNGALGGRTT